jgi:hypothetical protein
MESTTSTTVGDYTPEGTPEIVELRKVPCRQGPEVDALELVVGRYTLHCVERCILPVWVLWN